MYPREMDGCRFTFTKKYRVSEMDQMFAFMFTKNIQSERDGSKNFHSYKTLNRNI